jgi:hypothetical protein
MWKSLQELDTQPYSSDEPTKEDVLGGGREGTHLTRRSHWRFFLQSLICRRRGFHHNPLASKMTSWFYTHTQIEHIETTWNLNDFIYGLFCQFPDYDTVPLSCKILPLWEVDEGYQRPLSILLLVTSCESIIISKQLVSKPTLILVPSNFLIYFSAEFF